MLFADGQRLHHLGDWRFQFSGGDDTTRFWEASDGAVFVTGYMRSYARLLDLDPEPLLDALRSAGPLGEPRRPRVRRTSEPQVDSGHLVIRLVSIAIALIVAGLAFVWWQNQRPLTDLSFEPTLPPIAEATDQPATPEQPSVSEPVAPAVADFSTKRRTFRKRTKNVSFKEARRSRHRRRWREKLQPAAGTR